MLSIFIWTRLPGLEPTWFPSATMVLTNVRELAMLMRVSDFSCWIFWFGKFILCFMNDNIIVECSINVNIAIAVDYYVNINLYLSKSLAVLRFCWRLRVTFYKEVGPLWGHIYNYPGLSGSGRIVTFTIRYIPNDVRRWLLGDCTEEAGGATDAGAVQLRRHADGRVSRQDLWAARLRAVRRRLRPRRRTSSRRGWGGRLRRRGYRYWHSRPSVSK